MSEAREAILKRVRAAAHRAEPDREAEYRRVARRYRIPSEPGEARVQLFIDRLTDYGSEVIRCDEPEIADAVSALLTRRQKHDLLAPLGVPRDWLPEGFSFRQAEGLTYDEIDRFDGVITGASLAIALTGTLILRHSPEEGRRAYTLIPDYHLCIVFEDQVAGSVPEAIEILSGWDRAPITTVSGSSATSDIEMTRVKGVHGPRTLDVILVKREQ
jgi:L-lactate dehydrogenase complex protein LldG